eukprot:TRINITY_DN4294_c0_g1_i1.p1 TRINITY_DN4294_c0_g1~~TRINITY_DN4294_c0_g1_i1.p1  ORF type:complete len:127 (-),score=35.99 TRINITY_DN4294_c0_g1_i1:190-570(-)
MMKLISLCMMLAISIVMVNTNTLPLMKTQFCDECEEILVESTGGAAEHLPESMGRYSIYTSLWENMVPVWKNDNGMYLTPDSNSNPIVYYVKWVVGKSIGAYDATIMNDVYVDGFDHCPYPWTSEV